jgi:sterol desaturase/sphingolipid hydroxylase (fatty acid hydroxylase superfamily)
MNLENDPVIYAIPLFALVIAIELWINAKETVKLHQAKDSFASITMGLGSLAIGGFMKWLAFNAFVWLHQFALLKSIQWQWWAWLVLIFADDLTFYVHHRLSHEVRILWAAHVNHHSSQRLNYATALRQSWTEILYKYIWWLWLPLLGFEPIMIMTMMSVSLIFQFFQHTEIVSKLPAPIEWIFNTPSHHRVHHASNIPYLDRNHAGVFIIWDRIFGTFSKEEEKPVYGLTSNITSFNPLHIASHGFIELWRDIWRASRWSDKLRYILLPPGWSHDGEDRRAKSLRRQLTQTGPKA